MSSYWSAARAPRYSFSFALPLLALYELWAAAAQGAAPTGVRNGADVLLKSGFYAAAGPRGPIVAGALALAACLWVIARDARGRAVEPRLFGLMLAESLLFAASFGLVVGAATAGLLGTVGGGLATAAAVAAPAAPVGRLGLPEQLMLSVGAGLYEELLFRVLLVSLLAWGARRLLRWSPRAAGAAAVLVSALAFSAFHYVGAYGDPFTVQSFTFRALAGLAFSALYVARGFGITAWTHALYDVGFFLL
jgi:hypothetical protein